MPPDAGPCRRHDRARRAPGCARAARSGARRSSRSSRRALGSAARLAVENEALRAEAMAQLHALQASRARIVETADATRRRLERDLHDGAQQRLLALSYDLRVARAGAAGDGRRGAGLDCWTQPPTRPRPRSRSCASSRTASTRRSSPRRGSGRHSRRSPTRRRCPWSSATCRPSAPPLGVERTAYVVVDRGHR